MSKLEKFLEWCLSKNVEFNGLEIRSAGEGMGNGIFTTKFFRRDERCIRMPDDNLITAGMVADLPFYSELLDKSSKLLNPFEVLTLFFCLEKSPKSDWSPYLDILPETFETPAYQGKYYDPEDLPLSIRTFYETQLKDLRDNYENIKNVVPDLEHERYLWAWHVVNTRCIYVENKPHKKIDSSEGDTLAVIPFVDMLNHQPAQQCLALHYKLAKTYEVTTCVCIQEGEEVHVTYGPHDNPRLWMEYGFMLSENINEKVIIPKELFLVLASKAGIEIYEELRKVIYDANLPTTLYKSDEGPSYSFRSNVRILRLTREQLSKWQDIVYEERSEDYADNENVIDNSLAEENKILEKMMLELLPSLEQKKAKVHTDVRWMWDGQINIIKEVLKTVQTVEKTV